MIKSIISKQHEYNVDKVNNSFVVNGELIDCDISEIDNGSFQIIKNNKSYIAHVVKKDLNKKYMEISINKRVYKIDLKDENDMLLEQLGINNVTTKSIDALKAPMPGLIVEVMVEDGQTINEGQPLIILKAMKMENVLKAPHDAMVKQVLIEQNEKVEKDAVLIQF